MEKKFRVCSVSTSRIDTAKEYSASRESIFFLSEISGRDAWEWSYNRKFRRGLRKFAVGNARMRVCMCNDTFVLHSRRSICEFCNHTLRTMQRIFSRGVP